MRFSDDAPEQPFSSSTSAHFDLELVKSSADAEDVKRDARVAAARAADADLRARRTALGNVAFSGQLYRQALVTERVMHMTTQQLLEPPATPENLECVCKLLQTVGANLDVRSRQACCAASLGPRSLRRLRVAVQPR